MSNIYQRIDDRLKKIEVKMKEETKKELLRFPVVERYRGESLFTKLEACLKILTA